MGSLYERLLSQGEAKGHQEGRREGRQEGRQEVRREGLSQGRRETWDAAAAFMKENGIPVELISKFKNSLTESWA